MLLPQLASVLSWQPRFGHFVAQRIFTELSPQEIDVLVYAFIAILVGVLVNALSHLCAPAVFINTRKYKWRQSMLELPAKGQRIRAPIMSLFDCPTTGNTYTLTYWPHEQTSSLSKKTPTAAIVLLPTIGISSKFMYPTASTLSRFGFQVYLVDYPNFGTPDGDVGTGRTSVVGDIQTGISHLMRTTPPVTTTASPAAADAAAEDNDPASPSLSTSTVESTAPSAAYTAVMLKKLAQARVTSPSFQLPSTDALVTDVTDIMQYVTAQLQAFMDRQRSSSLKQHRKPNSSSTSTSSSSTSSTSTSSSSTSSLKRLASSPSLPPVFLGGESTGGSLAILAAARNKDLCRGLLLFSPVLERQVTFSNRINEVWLSHGCHTSVTPWMLNTLLLP